VENGADVTVMDIVAIGAALARTQLRAGRRVTVWNRAADRAARLVAAAARVAPDAAATLTAGPMILSSL